jgi:hypothetical protein
MEVYRRFIIRAMIEPSAYNTRDYHAYRPHLNQVSDVTNMTQEKRNEWCTSRSDHPYPAYEKSVRPRSFLDMAMKRNFPSLLPGNKY